jgi:hypothetical protein
MKLEFSRQIFEKAQISSFIKIRHDEANNVFTILRKRLIRTFQAIQQLKSAAVNKVNNSIVFFWVDFYCTEK